MPLESEEKRLILQQLYELRSCREEVRAYKDFLSVDLEQDAKEKALFAKELSLAERELDLQKRETELQREKAASWEMLYKSVTKKPGWGCKLKRIFTLGISRCN